MSKYPILIDQDTCISCGECVKECPLHCIELKEGKASYENDACFRCGHCFAVCPVGAVDMAEYDTTGCGDYVSMQEFDSEKLFAALKSRRTVRRFKNIPVEPEKVDMILEAGRYCQTAANEQGLAFTILGSKQDAIEELCMKFFSRFLSIGKPIFKQLRSIELEEHFFFKEAPLVIVVSGKNAMSKGLATSYMELMADNLGLGVLVSGFSELCFSMSPKIKKQLELPKGHKVYSVMVIGYPDVEFHRGVPRNPLDKKVL